MFDQIQYLKCASEQIMHQLNAIGSVRNHGPLAVVLTNVVQNIRFGGPDGLNFEHFVGSAEVCF